MNIKGKLNQIQALKGIAFLGVFLSHTGFTWFWSVGHWGVSVFLVLSGFMMTYSYYHKNRIKNTSLKDNILFAWKKIKNLYLLHIITMLAMLIFSFIGIKSDIRIVIPKILLNIFLMQEWFPLKNASINGVSWYLSTAVFTYFLFPIILKKLENIRDSKVILNYLMALLFIQVFICKAITFIPSNLAFFTGKFFLLQNISEWLIYFFPLTRCIDFIIGCLTGYMFICNGGEQTSIKNAYQYMTLFVIIILNCICVLYELHIRNSVSYVTGDMLWFTYSIIFTLSSVSLIYFIMTKKSCIANILTKKVLLFLGNISSCAFLIHYVVFRYIQAFCCHFFNREFYALYGSSIKLTIGFILTIFLTKLWMYTERYIRNRFSKKEIINDENQ